MKSSLSANRKNKNKNADRSNESTWTPSQWRMWWPIQLTFVDSHKNLETSVCCRMII